MSVSIPAPIRSTLHRLGIDRAIGYVLLGSSWTLLVRPVNTYFTLTYLSEVELGFFYTIGSVLGLQVFFELGLGVVTQQFASHEAGYLKWGIDGTLEGDPQAKSRLASLLRKVVGWYTVIAVLVAVVILPAGWYYFTTAPEADGVRWQLPWVWTVLATAGGLLITPLVTLLNGCGQIAWTARVNAIQGFVLTPTTWIVLVCGGGLLAAPFMMTLTLLLQAVWLAVGWRGAFLDLWRLPADGPQIDWWREVWPFQWRIAVSWLSGYFIFQLFNVVVLRYHGPRAAGRLGASLSIFTQIQGIALTWVNTKLPRFGALIAQRKFADLDALFWRALIQSTAVVVAGVVALISAVTALDMIGHPLGQKFLALLPLSLLAANAVMQHVTGAQALYLRAHRKEPYLVLSVVAAVLCTLNTYFVGRYVGVTAMLAVNSLLGVVVGVGGSTYLFVTKRREWHQGGAA
jgi:hypothetical protein